MFRNKKTQKVVQQSELHHVPNELLFIIFLFLDVKSLGRIARTCQLFNTLSSNDLVWKQQLINLCVELPTSLEPPVSLKAYYKSKFWTPSSKISIAPSREESLKILLLGSSGSKKAEVVSLLGDADNVRVENPDFRTTDLNIDGNRVKLQVWDMVGQDRFHTIASAYFRGAKGVFLTFNYQIKSTFLALQKLFVDASAHVPQDCKIMILGVKVSERLDIEVEPADVETFAQERNLEIQNVTLTNRDGVIQAFEVMTRQILLSHQKPAKEEKTEDNKKGCCVM